MDTKLLVGIAVAIVLVAVGAAVYVQRRRRTHLRGRFGPEYERTVKEVGDLRKAEAALESREKRVAKLQIRPLAAADQRRFGEEWSHVQRKFVDDPRGAVTDADRLVGEVMHARGYPLGDFEQRAADVSVDHPRVVEHYRAAREIAERHARGQADTEALRQAFVHYRELFTDLLQVGEPVSVGGRR